MEAPKVGTLKEEKGIVFEYTVDGWQVSDRKIEPTTKAESVHPIKEQKKTSSKESSVTSKKPSKKAL